MTRHADRETARRLRADGWPLRDIAVHLRASIASVSEWVRDVSDQDVEAPPPTLLPIWKSGRVRVCGRCGHTLPDECFARRGTGRQWWCRRCFVGYHQARLPEARRAVRGRIARAQEYVLELLRHTTCADCDERDPVVLEFDHLTKPRDRVSVLVARGAPLARIDEEISLCEVVCVNCHRRRTARRSPSWRTGLANETRRGPARARNLAVMAEELRKDGCVDCGERDVVVLDFDHEGVKTATISAMARSEVSVTRLKAEIAECVVRCANCHRRKTARERRYYRHLAAEEAA